MRPFISVIIPNRNGEATIGQCLEAAFSSSYEPFEVIVVDDGSDDHSIEIIERFPCALVRLEKHSGASTARNIGARHSKGDALFFTDADCLLQGHTLETACNTLAAEGPDAVVGGTYTVTPHDTGFFSAFQSAFINYSETKKAGHPDYVATHAMAIDAATFQKHGGFAENFLPILEDVEFSHRLRRAGCRLVVNPNLQVRHVFNFSLFGSLRNAFRKSLYWTAYSLENGDLLADSGTASAELKINVGAYGLTALLLLLALAMGSRTLPALAPWILAANLWANRGLIRAFRRAGGLRFAVAATAYYAAVYPLAVGAGALAGALRYFLMRGARGRS
jgi:glycosyltransferase involved in cell wall biosynthesis